MMQMMSLGEMATWLPLPGAIPQFCARYVDDAMGFAVGWNVSCAPSHSGRELLALTQQLLELVSKCDHSLC
jgi:amino acid permease